MKMKNKKLLQKVLYGLSLLTLVYTGYVLFYTYDSVTQYYTAYGSSAPVMEIVNNLISSAFAPFMFTIILYVLAVILGMMDSLTQEFEIVAEDQPDEDSKKEETKPESTEKSNKEKNEEEKVTENKEDEKSSD